MTPEELLQLQRKKQPMDLGQSANNLAAFLGQRNQTPAPQAPPASTSPFAANPRFQQFGEQYAQSMGIPEQIITQNPNIAPQLSMPTAGGVAPQMPQAPTQQAPQGPAGVGTVLKTPQVPSMESVGLNPLTTEQGLSATPSLQPQVPQANEPFGMDPSVQATRARLGAMFGEAPQTLAEVTAQDPASIAARQASENYAMESAAREARLPTPGVFQEKAVRDGSNMRGERQYTDSQIRDLAGGDATLMGRYKAMDEQGIDPATGQPRATEAPAMSAYQMATLAQKDREFNYKALKDEYNRLEQSGQQQEQDQAAYQSVMDNTSRLGKMAEEAIGLTLEPGTTGLGGAFLKFIPGSNANQLKEVLSVVQSDVALTRLANLKATGATLGQISKPELEMLQNSFDALKQNLKGERLREALVNYSNQLQNIESKVASAYEAKYGAPQGATQGSGTTGTQPQVSYEGSNYEIVQ